MPKLAERAFFGGTEEKIDRLGLRVIWEELEDVLTHFRLSLDKRNDRQGDAVLRKLLDNRFRSFGGWKAKRPGGVDWTKCRKVKGTQVCLGLEMQFSVSAQSDLIFVDLQDLRDEITEGEIDVGVIVAPSNKLAYFLSDGVVRYTDAVRAVERASASYLPLAVLALEHDGPGPSLLKRLTRQGKKVAG